MSSIECKCHSLPLQLCNEYGSSLVARKCVCCLKMKCEQLFEPMDTDLGGYGWDNEKCQQCNLEAQYNLIKSLVNK